MGAALQYSQLVGLPYAEEDLEILLGYFEGYEAEKPRHSCQ